MASFLRVRWFLNKLTKHDGLIDWNKTAPEIKNHIRGMIPWPGSFTYYRGKRIIVHRAEIATAPVPSPERGVIIAATKESILVATSHDALAIQELQLEAHKRLTAAEFIAGHKINAGERFGNS